MTTDYQIEKQQEEMDRVEAKLNIRTLTDFIYHVIQDKDQAHEIDQFMRNKLQYLIAKHPETAKNIKDLYGEGKK